MTAEDILEALAARQALESTPKAWLEAARGAISVEEAARRVEGEEDPELVERSKALFGPGEPEVDEQRLQVLLREAFPSPAPRGWWRGTLAIGLALAAALVLVVAVPWQGSASLPSYELELTGMASLERAPEAAGEVPRFYADRRFAATLRPWTAVSNAVEVAVYVCTNEGPRRLPVEPRVERSGVVEVEGDVAALGLAVGPQELLFVVGTAGGLPLPTTCDAALLDADRDARILRARIEILPPPR